MPYIRPKINKVRTCILTATWARQSQCCWVKALSSSPLSRPAGMGGRWAGDASATGAPGGAGSARTHIDLPPTLARPQEAGPPWPSLQHRLTAIRKAQRCWGIKAWTAASWSQSMTSMHFQSEHCTTICRGYNLSLWLPSTPPSGSSAGDRPALSLTSRDYKNQRWTHIHSFHTPSVFQTIPKTEETASGCSAAYAQHKIQRPQLSRWLWNIQSLSLSNSAT